ncbi:MAG: PIN domain-containing protein [Bacteroidales bacterium]|jgi:PIN domain nuclease of toxin-antitoxin system|nr:PIN domain-containing protein [Bacteroidales bacterium]
MSKKKKERYMLDTNALLGIVEGNRFTKKMANQIERFDGFIGVSIEALKEVVTLVSVKDYKLKCGTIENVLGILETQNIHVLLFGLPELAVLKKLPVYRNNLDPTDRAIVAHAIAQHATLISSDAKFSQYKDLDLWSF